MPPNSEIEKLERRWKDNPKGTVFAPYAEVLRKNGDVSLAIEVLRQGLELHPDHIPGNIVLGRCQLDMGEDGPAEAAFTHVLDLDVENVIALKALGDITERQGRLMEASNWLERLISVDPSNDEARDQLARVLAMRESAAAAITRPVEVLARPEPASEAPLPPPVPVIQPATPSVLMSEAGSGQIIEEALSDDAAIESAFEAFGPPSPVAPTPTPSTVAEADDRTVPTIPVFSRPPTVLPPLEVEPAELNLAEAVADIEPAPLEAFEPDVPFIVPAREMLIEPVETVTMPSAETPAAEEFAYRTEEVAPIELRPSGVTEFQEPEYSDALLDTAPGVSEFQVPDDSAALLGLTPGTSEFQMPNASEELTLSSAGAAEFQPPSGVDQLLDANSTGGSEFQPPNGVDAMLAGASALEPDEEVHTPEAEAAPPPAPPPTPKPWGGGVVTSGFAAITLMPTEEMSTGSPDDDAPPVVPLSEAVTAFLPPIRTEAEVEPVPAPETPATQSDTGEVVEESIAAVPEAVLAEMSSEASMVELVEVEPDSFSSDPLEDAPVSEGSAEPAGTQAPPASELRLIFPDDAGEVEAPRVRRISLEPVLPARGAMEAASAEPEPVLTETMAELYARQGHIPEALAVYRRLVERHPDDGRLADRVRALEAMDHTGARRLSYIAMDTGGESVESFFRALVDARPMGAGRSVPAPVESDDGSGAPTRPASGPLSLSAIFGEEAAVAKPPADSLPTPGGTDAFSFDQFFGGPTPGPGGASHPRTTGPGGEDLDQFQHWLKSLKR